MLNRRSFEDYFHANIYEKAGVFAFWFCSTLKFQKSKFFIFLPVVLLKDMKVWH